MSDASEQRPPSGPSTRAIHAGSRRPRAGDPLVPPIVASSTFYNAIEPETEVLYGRYSNTEPHHRVGARLAALEGAEAALVCASGMAAMSMAVLAFTGAGDHVVASRALYGGTRTLLTRELPRLGIDTTFVDPHTDWSGEVRAETRLLLAEVPINPTLRVPDLRPVARLARERDLPLVVDATFATPINFRPLEHGARLVIHSATKYLGGHSDLVAGVVAGGRGDVERVRERLVSFGPSVGAHTLWLLERGLKTLPVRIAAQNRTALALAEWLERHPAVEAVHHPGLSSHPDHRLARELFDGFGGMVAFVVRGGDAAARRAMERFELIAVAPSLGGVESLASMPRYTSHAAMSARERHASGIADGFIRLSVGVEDVTDLRADLDRALEA